MVAAGVVSVHLAQTASAKPSLVFWAEGGGALRRIIDERAVCVDGRHGIARRENCIIAEFD